MRKNLLCTLLVLQLLTISVLSGCSKAVSKTEPELTLNVSAAVSMQNALKKIGTEYEKSHPNIRLAFNFGSSGTLAAQIEEGAPTDVFISAGEKQVEELKEKGLIEQNSVRNLAGNRLFLIAPVEASSLSGLNYLAGAGVRTIAIGSPDTVPAGKYAKEALVNLGLWPKLKDRVIYTKDVRQVLTYVETGNADAGFVYGSDAQLSDQVMTLNVPGKYYSPIEYPALVVKDSTHKTESSGFLEYCRGIKAQEIFQAFGFLPPGEGD